MQRKLIVIIVVALATILIVSFSVEFWIQSNQKVVTAGGNLTNWINASSYPFPVAGASCTTYPDTMYCIGGNSSVYYANLNNPGIQTWTKTTNFPIAPGVTSCVDYEGYLYCVSGSQVYYTTISSSGVGQWSSGPSYPSDVSTSEACVAYSGYIYCVGSEKPNSPVNGSALDYVYYAPINSSGVGSWIETNPYPVASWGMSCTQVLVYMYCIGGQNLALEGGYILSSVYFAFLNSSGAFWRKTLNYPIQVELESCTSNGDDIIYCIGGDQGASLNQVPNSYFAFVSPAGVDSWSKTSSYPFALSATSCTVGLHEVYCIGGYVDRSNSDISSSYYNTINGPYALP